jgi:hypothetical protein
VLFSAAISIARLIWRDGVRHHNPEPHPVSFGEEENARDRDAAGDMLDQPDFLGGIARRTDPEASEDRAGMAGEGKAQVGVREAAHRRGRFKHGIAVERRLDKPGQLDKIRLRSGAERFQFSRISGPITSGPIKRQPEDPGILRLLSLMKARRLLACRVGLLEHQGLDGKLA